MIQPEESTGEDELESFDNGTSGDENEVTRHIRTPSTKQALFSTSVPGSKASAPSPTEGLFARPGTSVPSKAPTPSTKQAPSQARSLFGVPLDSGVTATTPSDNEAKQHQSVYTLLENKPRKKHYRDPFDSNEEEQSDSVSNDESEYCNRCKGIIQKSKTISWDLMLVCKILRMWTEDPEVLSLSLEGDRTEFTYVNCIRQYVDIIDKAGAKKSERFGSIFSVWRY